MVKRRVFADFFLGAAVDGRDEVFGKVGVDMCCEIKRGTLGRKQKAVRQYSALAIAEFAACASGKDGDVAKHVEGSGVHDGLHAGAAKRGKNVFFDVGECLLLFFAKRSGDGKVGFARCVVDKVCFVGLFEGKLGFGADGDDGLVGEVFSAADKVLRGSRNVHFVSGDDDGLGGTSDRFGKPQKIVITPAHGLVAEFELADDGGHKVLVGFENAQLLGERFDDVGVFLLDLPGEFVPSFFDKA